jgi:hypothetical protein
VHGIQCIYRSTVFLVSSLTSENNNNDELFAQVVGILLGMLRINETTNYVMLEEDRGWIRGEMIALLVRCQNKLQKSFQIKGFRQQDHNQLVIQFYSVDQKRDLFLIFKAKDRIYDLMQGVAAIVMHKTDDEVFGSTDEFSVGMKGYICLDQKNPSGLKKNPLTIYTIKNIEKYVLVVSCTEEPGQTWNIMPKVFKEHYRLPVKPGYNCRVRCRCVWCKNHLQRWYKGFIKSVEGDTCSIIWDQSHGSKEKGKLEDNISISDVIVTS